MPRFDPAEHLAKHGWQGKGTALKHGHATRPLAVVPKKTLSGIGKDRDEAIPFWDHIFASTAASLVSGQSSSSSTPEPVKPKLSAAARSGKEVARRGLYSRFFPGTSLSAEQTPQPEDEGDDVISGLGHAPGGSGSRSGSGSGSASSSSSASKQADVRAATEAGSRHRKGKSSRAATTAEERSEAKIERAERRLARAVRRAEKDAKKAGRDARRAARELKRTAKAAKRAKRDGKKNKSTRHQVAHDVDVGGKGQ